eukprot:12888363-Prorocentrum_lima.AAC.1
MPRSCSNLLEQTLEKVTSNLLECLKTLENTLKGGAETAPLEFARICSNLLEEPIQANSSLE